jgi:hypothetical protein
MKLKLSLLSLLVLVTLVVAACGGAASTPDAATKNNGSRAVMKEDSDATMKGASQATSVGDSDSMVKVDSDGMTKDESNKMSDQEPESTMTDDFGSMSVEDNSEVMVDPPAWFSADLTDVNTGRTFSIADFKDQVVLVETMAIWCSNCLRQQKEVKVLHEALGQRDGWVTIVLDIDPNEKPEDLKDYTARHGFDWVYAVAPRDVAREIGQLYGDQFLNPPSTPMLIIDHLGQAHPLPFGHKSAESLQKVLESSLSEGM